MDIRLKYKIKALGVFTSLLVFSLSASGAIEYVDEDTLSSSGKIMHICGVGLMTGLHVKHNDLLCTGVSREYPGLDDFSTSRHGMHACPLGTAMMGIHVKDNVLKCSIPTHGTLELGTEHVDSSTERSNMKACPSGYVMTGVHVKHNDVLCTEYLEY